MLLQWARRWGRSDNQEVGLEAAILERVRNSSLVEGSRADNVPGLNYVPKRRIEPTRCVDSVVGERRQAENHQREPVGSEDECECRDE